MLSTQHHNYGLHLSWADMVIYRFGVVPAALHSLRTC